MGVQFGVVNDKKRTEGYSKLPDDPLCGVPYLDGMVGFAAAGPNTRCHTLCFFLGDISYLGKSSVETPISMVCPESMATLHALHCAGDIKECGGQGVHVDKFEELGNAYIRSNFPACDYITNASRL